MKHDPEKRWLNKILPAVQAYSHAVVYSELVTFLNPRYRGPNFSWSGFVDICERTAVASAYSCFSTRDWNKFQDRITEHAKRYARLHAQEALDRSGILEWWGK